MFFKRSHGKQDASQNSHSSQWQRTRSQLAPALGWLVGCIVIASIISSSSLPPSAASSQLALATTSKPTVLVQFGFEGLYRSGFWTPLQVLLQGDNSNFQGTLTITMLTQALIINNASGVPASSQSSWSFQQAITLPEHAQQHITLSLPLFPLNESLQGLKITLRNANGSLNSEQIVPIAGGPGSNEVQPNELLVGMLTDEDKNQNGLTSVYLSDPVGMLRPIRFSHITLPDSDMLLENFNIIAIDNFDSATLSAKQLLALNTWVNKGGVLLEVGGPNWQHTLGSLPANLLPVELEGTTTLPAGTALLGSKNPMLLDDDMLALVQPLPTSLTVSTVKLRKQGFSENETVLASGTTPIFVQGRQGKGVINYLAIDPGSPLLSTWTARYVIWRMILLHSMTEEMLTFRSGRSTGFSSGPGELLTRARILDMLTPNALPGIWVLLALLLGYLLILGPVRFLITQRYKLSQARNWMIVLGGIGVFTLICYPLSFYLNRTSIVESSISLFEVNQDGTSAHVTTYSGLLTPTADTFQVDFPQNSLSQPIANQFKLRRTDGQTDIPTTLTLNQGTMNVTLPQRSTWVTQQLLNEHDTQLPGRINAQLSLNNNRLQGSIQNTLPTALSDAYILIPHRFLALGQLGPGETRQIDLPIAGQTKQGLSLANQIALSNRLPVDYFPYAQDQLPGSTVERHNALLAALDGGNLGLSLCKGSCKTTTTPDRNLIFLTGGAVPNTRASSYEPLLIDDAPATFIAWAVHPLGEGIAVNGLSPISQHDTFLQMPLKLNYSASQPLLPGQILGHPIKPDGDALIELPGIYSMSYGDLIFELLAPQPTQAKHLTITLPDLWAHPFGPATGNQTSHLKAQLYNWQIGAWDQIPLDPRLDTYTTSERAAYIGPDGRVLVQVLNANYSLGTLYFAPPTLSLS